MEQRIKRKIQYLSLILAISVIFIHTYNVEVYGLAPVSGGAEAILWHLESFFHRVQQNVCVPFFFTISGYLFFRNYSWDKVLEKYQSRIYSLLFPYLLWCTIYFVLYLFCTNVPVISRYMNMEKIPLSLSDYLNCVWNSTYATVLWFVKSLLLSIINAPIYYALFVKKKSRLWDVCSLVSSLMLIVYCALKDMGVIDLQIPFSNLNLYFISGGLLSVRCRTVVESRNKWSCLGGVIGSCACLLYTGIMGAVNSIWTLLFIASLWYAADCFGYNREPAWWMKQTFFVYCAHSFLLETLEKLWLILAGSTVWAAAVDYFVMPFVVLGILSVMAYFLNQYCHPIYKILTGGRGQENERIQYHGKHKTST